MNPKRFLSLTALAALVLCTQAHATVLRVEANLSGANENPANGSPGIGYARVFFDNVAHTLTVDVSFSGLTGTVTAAHIHAGAAIIPFISNAGVATQTPTFVGFPSGVTSGSYYNVFDTTLASSFNPAFVTANGGSIASAEAALFTYMSETKSYFNIHTSAFGGGEIRGFLVNMPDGGTTVLMLAGAIGVLVGLRRNRRICG